MELDITKYRNLPQFVDLWQEDVALEGFLIKMAAVGCVVDGHGKMGLRTGALNQGSFCALLLAKAQPERR